MTTDRPRLPTWARLYLWAAERLYHEFAWAYDAVSELVSGGRWGAWRSLALEHVRGPRVLELGYGTGALLVEMARRGLQPYGLERSRQMQRVATRRLHRTGLASDDGAGGQAPRVRGDAGRLPFADGVFDSVVSTFPSGYIARPDVLSEVARVLRPAAKMQCPPRLVIVGLVVEVSWPALTRLPWLAGAGSSERILERLGERAQTAGFRAGMIRHRVGGATVPVFVLEKEHAPWP